MCGRHPCEKPNCTHSESHRAACEARTVIGWPQSQRRSYYALVQKNRGDNAMRELFANAKAEAAKL